MSCTICAVPGCDGRHPPYQWAQGGALGRAMAARQASTPAPAPAAPQPRLRLARLEAIDTGAGLVGAALVLYLARRGRR